MFREADNERVLTILSHSRLLNDAKSWLLKNRVGVVHTNRELNTGWKQMKFDFSVTNGNDLCLYLCRRIIDDAGINRLYDLMDDVEDLYQSGIKQDNLAFSVELLLSSNQDQLSAKLSEKLKCFPWLKSIQVIGNGRT